MVVTSWWHPDTAHPGAMVPSSHRERAGKSVFNITVVRRPGCNGFNQRQLLIRTPDTGAECNCQYPPVVVVVVDDDVVVSGPGCGPTAACPGSS